MTVFWAYSYVKVLVLSCIFILAYSILFVNSLRSPATLLELTNILWKILGPTPLEIARPQALRARKARAVFLTGLTTQNKLKTKCTSCGRTAVFLRPRCISLGLIILTGTKLSPSSCLPPMLMAICMQDMLW